MHAPQGTPVVVSQGQRGILKRNADVLSQFKFGNGNVCAWWAAATAFLFQTSPWSASLAQ